MANTERIVRSDSPVDQNGRILPWWWNEYAGPWGSNLRRAVAGTDGAYESFTRLEVYEQSLDAAISLVPEAPGGIVINLGCGPGNDLRALFQATHAAHVFAADISSEMLSRTGREAEWLEQVDHIGGRTHVVEMDISEPWDEFGNIKADVIFSHIAICWLTPEQREGVFREIAAHLNEGGRAIIALRNDKWNDGRVRKHIVEELLHDVRACFGAMFARTHTDKMSRTTDTLPSWEELTRLAKENGLEIVQSVDTFWPDDPEGAAGWAIEFRLAEQR